MFWQDIVYRKKKKCGTYAEWKKLRWPRDGSNCRVQV